MVVLSLSIAIPMTFMSNWLTDLLYGDAFPLTGPVLSIHIWSGVFVFLGVSVNKWILNENLQHYSSIYLFLGMVANIILNIVMIPKYGIFGAALATLYSQAFSTLLAPLLFKKTRPAFFMMLEALSFTLFKSRKSKI
jgi:O-antigen/teichoic acid export membrane protein